MKNPLRFRSVLLAGLALSSACWILPAAFAQTSTPGPAATAHARIVELRAQIAHNDELYFKQAAPAISDADYDRLKRELAALEQAYPEFAGVADLTALGDDRSGRFPTVRHRVRMQGLAKSYSADELRAFLERVKRQLGRDDLGYVVEPKFDGLAISVTYEHGKLTQAVTRGNGVEGDDVTANVRTIRSLPAELRAGNHPGDPAARPIPDLIELRGEIYLSYAEFKRINAAQEAAGEETFANPRNLAAGTLKQADPAAVAARRLEIVFYGIGACEPAVDAPRSQQALHACIKAWGLPGVDRVWIAHDPAEAWSAVETIGRERSRYPYPTDGAVVKVDEVALQQRLGLGEDVPNWAMAYKFTPERGETRIRAITLQIGRTGLVTPVAELDPVRLGGSTIARASLHNFAEIRRRDLRVGDYVYIEKAGEIVPAIAGVDLARRSATSVAFEVPATCPECHQPLAHAGGEVAIRCVNASCPAQVRRRIQHFASDACVDLDGFGPALVERLVAAGKLATIADLYHLRRDDLLSPSGGAGRTADRVLESIDRSKRAELWRFVLGLGIPDVGPTTARAIAARFGSLTAVAAATREDFFSNEKPLIPGVGAAASTSVLAFFSLAENQELVKALLAAGVAPASPAGSDAPRKL